MRRLPRHIPALVLIALYAIIVAGPLAPLAMRSAAIAHALTGECSGDCSICGCSTERSASHTCCCWQKKQPHINDKDQDEPECCRKLHATDEHTSVSIKTLPCSSGKALTFWGAEQIDVIPYRISQINLELHETASTRCNPACLADWPGDPPDPPPKIS